MKTMKLLSYLMFSIILGLSLSSCSEEGLVGPAGADGVDGMDGADGIDGTDGANGTANAQTYVFDNPAWGSEYWMDIDMSDVLTDDVIENDVILGYLVESDLSWISIPLPGATAVNEYRIFIFDSTVPVSSLAGTYRIISHGSASGDPTPVANLKSIEQVKIIVIETSNTTTTEGNGGKIISGKEAVYQSLKEAGVDIKDYDQVVEYYGIQ